MTPLNSGLDSFGLMVTRHGMTVTAFGVAIR